MAAKRPIAPLMRCAPLPSEASTAAVRAGSASDHRISPSSSSRPPTQRNRVARFTPSSAASSCISMRRPAMNHRRATRNASNASGLRSSANMRDSGVWPIVHLLRAYAAYYQTLRVSMRSNGGCSARDHAHDSFNYPMPKRITDIRDPGLSLAQHPYGGGQCEINLLSVVSMQHYHNTLHTVVERA